MQVVAHPIQIAQDFRQLNRQPRVAERRIELVEIARPRDGDRRLCRLGAARLRFEARMESHRDRAVSIPRASRPDRLQHADDRTVGEAVRPELIDPLVVDDEIGMHRQQFVADNRGDAVRQDALAPRVDDVERDRQMARVLPLGEPSADVLRI